MDDDVSKLMGVDNALEPSWVVVTAWLEDDDGRLFEEKCLEMRCGPPRNKHGSWDGDGSWVGEGCPRWRSRLVKNVAGRRRRAAMDPMLVLIHAREKTNNENSFGM